MTSDRTIRKVAIPTDSGHKEKSETDEVSAEKGKDREYLASVKSDNVELNKILKIRKVNNETPYSVVPLASKPQILTCPHCQHYVTTEVAVRPSVRTHMKALLLAMCW